MTFTSNAAGGILRIRSLAAANDFSQIGVEMLPGSTTITAMSHGRSSTRSESEIDSRANFEQE